MSKKSTLAAGLVCFALLFAAFDYMMRKDAEQLCATTDQYTGDCR